MKTEFINSKWKQGISDLINQFLEKNGISGKYQSEITFYENFKLLKDKQSCDEKTFLNILQSARKFAFDKKYGAYDYNIDIRKIFPNWADIAKKNINLKKVKDIVAVGANFGIEIEQLVDNLENKNVTVLDISEVAIEKGKSLYPKFNFVQGDMEEDILKNESYDLCICLRAIHSRGVLRMRAILQMSKLLRSGGQILVSISNGYLASDGSVIKGLYDQRKDEISKSKPLELANKVMFKLSDYGFNNLNILDGDTEVFIVGTKK